MRSLILMLSATLVGAVEIVDLPKEVTIDPKEILGGKEYEVFDTGYVTVRMQKYGYLDAKVTVRDGKMTAIPGSRYTIRSLAIKGTDPEKQPCEIPITPDNMDLLRRIFSDFEWVASYTAEDHGVHYLFTPK